MNVWHTHRLILTLSALGGVALVYFVDPSQHSLVPCVFHAVTGLHCAGCGMTRAAHQLLHAHWDQAWAYNPLVFAVLPAAFYGLVRQWFGPGTLLRLPSVSEFPVVVRVAAIVVLTFMVLRNVVAF